MTPNDYNTTLQGITADLSNLNANLATNIANYQSNKNTNATNLAITNNTNALNQQLNEANIAFQQRENEINRAREDNAVWRRVQDLTRSGLSKTLAAGQGASANAMQAPSNDFEMKSAHMQAFQAQPFTKFGENYMKARALDIDEKQQDLYKRELDIKKMEADALASHYERQDENDSKAIDENKRYHDLMDQWEKDKLDETSRYHNEALKLDWARHELDNQVYLTDAEHKSIENLWYRFQMYSGNKKLTAELAESSARVMSYLADVDLSNAQARYIEKNSRYIAVQTVNAMLERGLMKAQYKNYMIEAITKLYNLAVSVKQRSKTNDSTVSTSSATENALDRKAGLRNQLFHTGATVLSIGAGVFLGAGGGKFIQKKLFDHDPFGGDMFH